MPQTFIDGTDNIGNPIRFFVDGSYDIKNLTGNDDDYMKIVHYDNNNSSWHDNKTITDKTITIRNLMILFIMKRINDGRFYFGERMFIYKNELDEKKLYDGSATNYRSVGDDNVLLKSLIKSIKVYLEHTSLPDEFFKGFYNSEYKNP